MPSKRKQFNVRADRETEALIPAIIAAIKEQTGLEPTQSDLFRMGLVELRRKYGVIPIPETAPIKPAKRKTA